MDTKSEIKAVEAWLAALSEAKLLRKGLANSQNKEYVVGGGVFLGVDTSAPDASKIEIFSDPKNLPTAISSLLGLAQNSANFHPGDPKKNTTSEDFSQYINKVDQSPFFSLTDTARKEGTVSSKDYDSLIDSIVDVYKGVLSDSVEAITNSVENMAKNVFSQEQAEQSEDLFAQNVIAMSYNNDFGYPIVTIAYTHLHMETQKDGKSSVSSQSFLVTRSTYRVLDAKIHAYADILSGQDTQDVEDWLKSMNTNDDTKSTPCIKTLLKSAVENSKSDTLVS